MHLKHTRIDEISFWNAVEQQSASLQAKVCTAVTTENKFFIDKH